MFPSFSPQYFAIILFLTLLSGLQNTLMAQQPGHWDETCISYIPNTISPNGDGINDSFQVQTACELSLLQISIYDDQGQVIFETYSPTTHWDGTINGQQLPEGYYNWVVSYQDPRTDEMVRYQGEVALLN